MIELEPSPWCAETRTRSGVLPSHLGLSGDLEAAGRSSVWLESLRHDRRGVEAWPSKKAAIEPGVQVGRYRLIERLGQGSQAEVWKACRIEPDPEIVALKVLPAEWAREPKRRERFQLEASLGARLASPAILPTYEFGEDDERLYLAMPLIEGGSLGDLIAQRRRTPTAPGIAAWWADLAPREYTDAVVRLLIKIGRALDVVHSSRVAHRDIKPANILLDRLRDDRVYLCDFGLGCHLDAEATPSPADGAGTPLYMAPEKLLGREVDEVRCDVYSLGVTLFETLTLVHPFPIPKNLPQSCLATYLTATEPFRLRELQPALPAPLEAIVARAMERDPERRYRSVSELTADLQRFLATAAARPHASRIPRPKFATLGLWPPRPGVNA